MNEQLEVTHEQEDKEIKEVKSGGQLPNEEDILDKIVNTNDIDELKDLTHLFNLNQSKKNILRISKLNDLLDKVSDQAMERLDTRAFDISDRDLMTYMQVFQNTIDKSQQNIENATSQPMIQINQQNNINIEEGGLSKESRDKILSVIDTIKKMAEENINNTQTEENTNLIDNEGDLND